MLSMQNLFQRSSWLTTSQCYSTPRTILCNNHKWIAVVLFATPLLAIVSACAGCSVCNVSTTTNVAFRERERFTHWSSFADLAKEVFYHLLKCNRSGEFNRPHRYCANNSPWKIRTQLRMTRNLFFRASRSEWPWIIDFVFTCRVPAISQGTLCKPLFVSRQFRLHDCNRLAFSMRRYHIHDFFFIETFYWILKLWANTSKIMSSIAHHFFMDTETFRNRCNGYVRPYN